MAIKRKAASTIVKGQVLQVEEEVEAPAKFIKKVKAQGEAAKNAHKRTKTVKLAEEAAPDVEVNAGTQESTLPPVSEEGVDAQEDESAARSKELKAMTVDDLKGLVEELGLQKAKKAEMIEAVLELEAATRIKQMEHEENLRRVVVQKKEELASLPINELRDLSKAAGAGGQLTKEARVELLLTQWQERGGIDQALAQIAKDKREGRLLTMDASELRKLCDASNVDTLVQEVMIDRLLRRETELGTFAPPVPMQEEVKVREPEATATGDLVTQLLANEAARAKKKAEEDMQKARETLEAKKKDALRSSTVSELKQRLASKGAATSGTKDELVEALFALEIKDAALAERKGGLKDLGKDGLKELLATKGIKASGGINEMIDAFFQHEAKCEEGRRAYEAAVMEQLKKKKEELEAKTGAQLKELCAAKGMSTGVSNEDRVQRLLRAAKDDGEIEKAIFLANRAARRKALEAMDKTALLQLCQEVGVDPLVKTVLVERLLEREAEDGQFAAMPHHGGQ